MTTTEGTPKASNTPIFDAVAAELGVPELKPPAIPALGYKAKKRLAGMTNKALREAGLTRSQVE